MKVNIFEGSRRITRIIQGVWIITCIGYAILDMPYVTIHYKLIWPSTPFLRMSPDEACNANDAQENISSFQLAEGKTISINLCFIAQTSNDGRMLVPYKIEENKRWWGGTPYSSDVIQYTKGQTGRFVFSSDDRTYANNEWDKKRRGQFWSAIQYAVGGCLIIFIIQMTIGWIVRGFLGIPLGADHRPEHPLNHTWHD